MKSKLKITTLLTTLLAALFCSLSASAEDLETYTHKLTQSDSAYEFWTTPPSERVFKDDEVPSETGSEVRVYAAKNEFEPFQIVVRPNASGSVSVNIGDFGSGITSEIYQVKYVNIIQATDNLGKTGDYPDPLWPVEKGASVNLMAGENTAFWFSLSVPETAASKDYTANVEIGGVSIPVRLHVFNFAIPDELHVKSQMNFSHQTVLDKYGVSGSDNYWMYLDKMKQFFIDHRLTSKSPLWSSGITSNGGKPYIDYDCDAGELTDTEGIWGFEKPAERYLGGSGLMDGKFTEAFNGGTGFPSIMAATFQNNDASDDQRPSAFCGITRGTGDWYTADNPNSAYNTKWFSYMKVLQDYLDALGYLDKAYYYMANEPQDQDDYDAVAWYSQELKKAAPNLKLMVSEEPKSEIYNHPTHTGAKIDIWLPVLNKYDPEISHEREKNHQEETWIYFLHGTRPPYFNPITLDHPGVESKFTGWFLWKYRIKGIAYYSLNSWSKNPWTDPMTDDHNGDTFMLYPPSETNDHIAYGSNNDRFVPSIRFELMRDSLEDYEYLYVLNGGSQPVVDQSNAADTKADKIISGLTSYTRDGEFMYNLRRVIGLKNGNEIDTIPDITIPSEGTPGNYYINFQNPDGDPTEDPLVVDGKEYMKIGVNAYDETLGYGWFGKTENFKTNYDPWGDEKNELKRSYAYDDWAHNPNTFQFDLPNGTYNVELCAGSPRQSTPQNKVIVEGVTFIDDEAANTYLIRTGEVTVSDGNLTLEVGIWDKYTFLCYLNIEAAGGTTLPECAESDWESSDGECQSDSTLTRTWTKTGDCEGGVSHPATESVSCEYQLPGCTESDWESSDGECQPGNTLTRTWTKTGDCDGGVSHLETESIACEYQESVDDDVPCDCSPLPDPGTDETVAMVSTADALQNEINSASGPKTIYLESGTYNVSSSFFINVGKSDITIRSESGNRDDVIIQGEGMGASETGHGIYIDASRITIADLTIRDVPNHAIIVQPGNFPSDLLFHNIRCVDTGQQIVKVSGGVDSNPKNRGIIQCSVFEYTTTLDEGAYTNGIDILNAHDWIIRDNVIRNIKAAPGAEELAGPAILAWHESSNTIVERNQIIDCDVGISFGNAGQSGISHTGGIIRNNFIKGHSESDFGIGIIFAPDAQVLNNTIYSPGSWEYSIEARFSETTNCLIMNNLADEDIYGNRDGASSTLTSNVTDASESDFADVESGNLHLSDNATIAVDQGTASEDVSADIDCQSRPVGDFPDIGADEKCLPVSGTGDLSGDCTVSLGDAILAIQVVVGQGADVSKDEDMNADGRVGLYEAIRILSDVSSAR